MSTEYFLVISYYFFTIMFILMILFGWTYEKAVYKKAKQIGFELPKVILLLLHLPQWLTFIALIALSITLFFSFFSFFMLTN